MDRLQLREIVLEQNRLWNNKNLGIIRERLAEVKKHFSARHAVLISGIRRTGKSTLLRQIMHEHFQNKAYYLSFEDERLLDFKPADFNLLYEIWIELYGERTVFFLDEIQNAPGWENFVRRMQDQGGKFFLTGSNASLLSREFGTKLTGRSITIELFPFTFREWLAFRKLKISEPPRLLGTAQRAHLRKSFHDYLLEGGMPEFLQYGQPEFTRQLYDDILYRDIVARHEIKEVHALRELALFYVSQVGSRFSFNKLKNTLQLGSMNTVRAYTDYLSDTYLFFTVNRFSYSLRQQMTAPKKIYCVDNGFVNTVAFQFSKNVGHLLENLVYVSLRRRTNEIYFYQTRRGQEVDFLLRRGRLPETLIQVTQSLSRPDVRKREVEALQEAMAELSLRKGYILVEDGNEDIRTQAGVIHVKPIDHWLLEGN